MIKLQQGLIEYTVCRTWRHVQVYTGYTVCVILNQLGRYSYTRCALWSSMVVTLAVPSVKNAPYVRCARWVRQVHTLAVPTGREAIQQVHTLAVPTGRAPNFLAVPIGRKLNLLAVPTVNNLPPPHIIKRRPP